MNDKITRRRLAAAALGSAAALGPAAALRAAGTQAPAPASPPDLTAAARDQVRKYSETLAKFDLPMSTEPAFQFKA
jgi:hypothetical protein